LGCTAGLTLALIYVGTAGQLVVTQWGMVERGLAINWGPRQIQNYASIKEVWFLVFGLFMFVSVASSGLSLVSDPGGRLGGLGGKVESDCDKCEDNEG